MRRPGAVACLAALTLALAGCAPFAANASRATRPAAAPASVSPASAPVTDGGKATVTAPQPPGPYTAVAVAGATVWVAGSGFIASSGDGGATWQRHALSGLTPSQITFRGPGHGWVFGQMIASCRTASACTHALLASTDGGRSWRQVAAFRDVSLSSIQFVSATTGYAARSPQGPCRKPAGCAQLVRTTDGGRTWAPVPAPAPVGAGLHFADAAHGWMIGSRCAGNAPCAVGIFATANGGRSWTEQLTTTISADQGGGWLAFAGPEDGWALIRDTADCSMGGCWGELYRTLDGGQTWSRLQPINHWRITAIDTSPGFPGQPRFTGPQSGWIPIDAGAGPGVGGVAWTADGGRTWTRVGRQRLWDIHAVATSGGRTVWAIGDRHGGGPTTSYLVRSTDGGRTWQQVLPALSPLRALDFVSGAHGYGIGLPSDPGAVLATTDGGRTWREVARIRGAAPATASFVGRDGWVGDGSGRILHSTDGGRTWTPLPSAPDPVVYLRFLDATHGVRITGHLASRLQALAIATTANGGETWSASRPIPAGGDLAAVAFADARHGLLIALPGGAGYRLRRTSDGGMIWTDLAGLPMRQPAPTSAFFLTPARGWVSVGSRLLATTDGGASWSVRALDGYTPMALDFISAHAGWMIDRAGTLLITTDGGASWHASITQPLAPPRH